MGSFLFSLNSSIWRYQFAATPIFGGAQRVLSAA